MPARPIDGPAVEPVGASEMRDYLRLDDGAEDALVAALIRAARLAVEAASGRVLIDSRWRVQRDGWPADGVILLPVSPLIAVERVRVVGPDGEVADLPAGLYDADLAGDPPRLIVDPRAPEPGRAWSGVVIEVRAGFGASPESVPEPLRQAIRLLVARWFENRGDAASGLLPPDVQALIAPFRRMRL
jgi:uncharacterized phiE125 gp8 family phage protein